MEDSDEKECPKYGTPSNMIGYSKPGNNKTEYYCTKCERRFKLDKK